MVLTTPTAIAAEEGQWIEKQALPTDRYNLGSVALNGEIYAIGGINSSNLYSSVEVYSPSTGQWSQGASLPEARGGAGVVASGGKIYVIGGRNESAVYDTVYIYDPPNGCMNRRRSNADNPLLSLDSCL